MRLIVLVLLALLPSASFAQKAVGDLAARLVDKPLFLRGQWDSNRLRFDASGQLQSKSEQTSFTLSGIEIKSVKLEKDGLMLEGERVGLEFRNDIPQRVDVQQKMTIHIQQPSDGDYSAPLDAILTGNLADLVARQSEYWQPYVHRYFILSGGAGASPSATTAVQDAKPKAAPGPHTDPVLIRKIDPPLTDVAEALKPRGVSVITCVVDERGKPVQLQILHPMGLGMDELALGSVSQYVFKPATYNGKPVAVHLNVEVAFQMLFR